MTNINEFLNRIELKIIEKIEERVNNSIQQLKIFSNKLDSNQSLVQFINELSFCFWSLIETIIDYSYYIQPKSENELNIIETTLLSHIDLLNEFHQRRCDLSTSNSLTEFDKEISKELYRITMDISNQLSTISLPNYTTSIIRNT